MLSEDQALQLRRAVRRFETAVREHEVKGATHPEDFDAIEYNYELRKRQLFSLIKQHEQMKTV